MCSCRTVSSTFFARLWNLMQEEVDAVPSSICQIAVLGIVALNVVNGTPSFSEFRSS